MHNYQSPLNHDKTNPTTTIIFAKPHPYRVEVYIGICRKSSKE